MPADPNIASSHHTHHQQAQAACRIIARQIEAIAVELDDENSAKRLLLQNAEEYRLAGEGVPRCLQGAPGRGGLRLVHSPN